MSILRVQFLFCSLLLGISVFAAERVVKPYVDFLNSNQLSEISRPLLVIYNYDNSVRGGAYELVQGSSIYITNLHTIQRSPFMYFHLNQFSFYGFKQKINSEKSEYQSIDVVLLIDTIRYPMGYSDPHVQNILRSLGNRTMIFDFKALAVNGLVPDPDNKKFFSIQTNVGRISFNSRGPVFEVIRNTSTITAGSSGTIILARSSDVFNQESAEYDADVPIGILKCREIKPNLQNKIESFEIQTLKFLVDPSVLVEEFQTIPPILFDQDCININARLHGGA